LLSVVLFAARLYSLPRPQLPAPYATKSVNNGPRVIPQPARAKLTVPPRFHIELWAEDFNVPRFMMLGPSNEIVLADSGDRTSGCVYVLPGKARKKIITGLQKTSRSTSIRWWISAMHYVHFPPLDAPTTRDPPRLD
jgi:hypothetical protein